jgi:hypothetical protein
MWCTVPRAKVATGMIREATLECANVPYVTLVDEPVLLLQEADEDPYTAHPVPEQQEAGKHVGEWVLCVFRGRSN